MTDAHLSQTRRATIVAALAAAAGLAAGAARSAVVEEAGLTADARDWDYYIGDWTVVNRRLEKRWVANPQWETFTGTARFVKYLDGAVNVSEVAYPAKGITGLTVRVLDPDGHRWSVYWISGKGGGLGPPMIGGFRADVGRFHGDDTDDGRPIKVRVLRTKQRPDREHWEQAFSLDGGASWETNWTADFTRVHT